MWYSNGSHRSSDIIMNPVGSSGSSQQISSAGDNLSAGQGSSLTQKGVEIYADSVGSIKAFDEYIRIKASSNNSKPLNISGWSLRNKSNENMIIRQGAQIAYSAQANKQEDIFLTPGEEAVIVTGKSPIGTNFHLNICSGYFEQFQDFYPPIKNDCPAISDIPDFDKLENDKCTRFLNNIPSCNIPLNISQILPEECSNFIDKHLSYNGCVNDFMNDKNFYSPHRWLIYLGRDNEFWQEGKGTIKLFDRYNNLVTQTTY